MKSGDRCPRTGAPTAEYLRTILRYEPETGSIYWLPRPLPNLEPLRGKIRSWNTRYAGKDAGTTLDSSGRRMVRVARKPYLSSRVIWCIVTGKWPRLNIDHIDGDPANNRISNLREVTQSINLRNAKRSSANTSGHTGVNWDSTRGKWRAHVKVNGRGTTIGRYDDINDAITAVALKRAEIGNFTERHGK